MYPLYHVAFGAGVRPRDRSLGKDERTPRKAMTPTTKADLRPEPAFRSAAMSPGCDDGFGSISGAGDSRKYTDADDAAVGIRIHTQRHQRR